MKKDLAAIAIVLDRSGSMASCRESTISGFNKFVEGQKAAPGEAYLSLAQFDSEDPFELIFDRCPICDVPELTGNTFIPRGGTPLHDAIGRMIVSLGEKLAGTREQDRPSHVVVVIMTDGQENASHEYEGPEIAQMIAHQQKVYNWQFVFIGANQDAILTGRSLNIPMGASMNMNCFDPNATISTYTSTSAAVTRSRTMGGPISYTAQERKAAMQGDSTLGGAAVKDKTKS